MNTSARTPDPLFVSSSKQICTVCKSESKQKRLACTHCNGTGWEPLDLSNWWSCPAFLVCGGPSLNAVALNRLRERGVMSLGVNNSAGYAPCSAFVFSDGQEKFHSGIYDDGKTLCFVPTPKLGKRIREKLPDGSFRYTQRRICDAPGVVGYSRSPAFHPGLFLTTDFAHWGMGGKQPDRAGFRDLCSDCSPCGATGICPFCNGKKCEHCALTRKKNPTGKCRKCGGKKVVRPYSLLSTMLLGIRILCYLGCPRIYMLGVDFWRESKDKGYAFNESGSGGVGRYNKEEFVLSEIRPTLEAAGITVKNCGPLTRSEAYERCTFQEALDDCRGPVPREPWDLSGWYSKKLKSETTS